MLGGGNEGMSTIPGFIQIQFEWYFINLTLVGYFIFIKINLLSIKLMLVGYFILYLFF
jgi:hypothetical protein